MELIVLLADAGPLVCGDIRANWNSEVAVELEFLSGCLILARRL